MVSIIIPFHEGKDYLKDCLCSLTEQTFKEIEVLVICDHIREDISELFLEYDPCLNIKVFTLETGNGVAAARNFGLKNASGEYVYFLDSDDYLYPNTIEKLASSAMESGADIIYGKKKWTWFQKNVYFASLNKEKNELRDSDSDSEEKEDENKVLKKMENENNRKDSSEDDNDDNENEANDQNHGKDSEDFEEKENSDDTENLEEAEETADFDDTDLVADVSLTPEEVLALEERRRKKRINEAYRIQIVKRKGIRNISVLNILFKRSYLQENQIEFPKQIKYFSDLPFLLEALDKTDKLRKCMSALYVKRRHNDPINLPSLSQIKDSNRFSDYIDSYYESISRISYESIARTKLDKKIISYYINSFAPKLRRSQNELWQTKNFKIMQDIMKQMNPNLIKSLKGYRRRLIKALLNNNIKKSKRIITYHLGFQKLGKILKDKKAFYRVLYKYIFLKMQLKENYVLYESFFGKSYAGNPKYIYEYMAKKYRDRYKFIWVFDKKNKRLPYKHKSVKRFGLRYTYYLARSKYYIFNSRQPEWVVKRKGNIFLQTWHGTPLKKLVFDQDDVSSATPRYKEQVYKQSRAWDFLIAPNEFARDTFKRCFMFEKKILETGYPRNDILHAPDKEILADTIRNRIGIQKDKKIILYAPTWRDDEYYSKGKYKFQLQLDLNRMKECIGNEYVILIRTHYFIADAIDVSEYKGFAYNLSKYDDISELYLISDLLITDYSSVFFDYANLKRPMLFYTYDLEKYRDVLRGFYFDIEKLVPGPILFTTEEVINAIQNINSIHVQYEQRYYDFYNRFCSWEDGHAAENVVKSIFGRQ